MCSLVDVIRLKQSAVDAWMRSEAAVGPWCIRGSSYVGEYGSVTRPVGGINPGGIYTPTVRSEGHGDADSKEMTEYFQSSFDNIRSTIDAILGPWSDVPVAGSLDGALDVAREIAQGLKNESSLENGVILPANGVLAGALKRIDNYAGYMAGRTIHAFKESFLNHLSGALNNIGLVARVLRRAIEAQNKILVQSAKDREKILDWVQRGLDEVVESGSLSPEVQAKQLEILVDLMQMVPGPVGVVANTAGKLVDWKAKLFPGEARKPSDFWDAEDIRSSTGALQQLRSSFEAIADQMYSKESQVVGNLRANVEVIWNDRSSFDLKPSSVNHTDPEEVDKFDLHPTEIAAIIGDYMPDFAAELERIAGQAEGCKVKSLTGRSSKGLTPNGAGEHIDDFCELLRELLVDIAAEVLRGAHQLQLAYEDFVAVEDENIRLINRLLADLESVRVHDPLDSSQPDSFEEDPVAKPNTLDIFEIMGARRPNGG